METACSLHEHIYHFGSGLPGCLATCGFVTTLFNHRGSQPPFTRTLHQLPLTLATDSHHSGPVAMGVRATSGRPFCPSDGEEQPPNSRTHTCRAKGGDHGSYWKKTFTRSAHSQSCGGLINPCMCTYIHTNGGLQADTYKHTHRQTHTQGVL